jgi:hypothetical protein
VKQLASVVVQYLLELSFFVISPNSWSMYPERDVLLEGFDSGNCGTSFYRSIASLSRHCSSKEGYEPLTSTITLADSIFPDGHAHHASPSLSLEALAAYESDLKIR